MTPYYFDYLTLFIYMSMGIVSMVCVRGAVLSSVDSKFVKNTKSIVYYSVLAFAFTMFAAVRQVDKGIGGADAFNYVIMFQYSVELRGSYNNLLSEPLFYGYQYLVRLFTDNYHIYFFISYAIIAFSYVLFIKTYACKKMSFLPFICLVFPFLKAFCTMRSSLAIAVMIIGFCLIEKHKKLATVVICASFLVHRSMLVSFGFVLLYFIFHKIIDRLNKKQLLIFVCAVILASVLFCEIFQLLLVETNLFSFLDRTDTYYISKALQTNLLKRWPMYINYIALFVVYMMYGDKLEKTKQNSFLKAIFIIELVAVPIMLTIGMWRFNELFYVARLLLWGKLIPHFKFKRFTYSNNIIKVLAFLFFLSWLVFRICSEWRDLRIMPYIISI